MMIQIQKNVRFGILGAGRVVQLRYVDVFLREVSGACVTVVCDKDFAKAQKVAKLLNATPTANEHDLFNSNDVDVVLVATESGNHYEHARQALLCGKHVVVEKPPALLPQQVLACEALAQQKKLMYAVIFQNRMNPAIMVLKEHFNKGRFGKIVLATIRLRWCRYQDYYEDGWHGTWAMDGGVICQQAIHHLDALQWVCGPIDEVFAFQSNAINRLEAEDTTVATVRFVDGTLGAIEATTAARPDDMEASISVLGEKGVAVINGIALNKIETWRFVEPQADDAQIPKKHSQDVPNGYGLSHAPLMQKIITGLAQGSIQPPFTGKDTVSVVKLVHALYKSVEGRRVVKFSEESLSARLGVKA